MSLHQPKILVIRGGAIGDFILTLPAIAALRRQFPKAQLEVLGYPHIAQLALAGGLVDRVQPIEARALASFFAKGGPLDPGMADYFSEFDLVISYLFDPDEIFQTNVAQYVHGQYISAPHRPKETERIHATQVYLKVLERLAIFDADPVPRLTIPSLPATPWQIALHPGSGSDHKNWAEANWASLIARLLANTDFDILLVGGEAEGERLQRLAATLPPTRCRVAQSLPLTELARRLRPCAGFVGHDSGISHLAAALGLPCVVLWAHTIEEIWRPQGERITILRDVKGIQRIGVEAVFEAIKETIGAARPKS